MSERERRGGGARRCQSKRLALLCSLSFFEIESPVGCPLMKLQRWWPRQRLVAGQSISWTPASRPSPSLTLPHLLFFCFYSIVPFFIFPCPWFSMRYIHMPMFGGGMLRVWLCLYRFSTPFFLVSDRILLAWVRNRLFWGAGCLPHIDYKGPDGDESGEFFSDAPPAPPPSTRPMSGWELYRGGGPVQPRLGNCGLFIK